MEQISDFIKQKKEMGHVYQTNLSFLKNKGFQLPLEKTAAAENIYWVFGLVASEIKEKEQLVQELNNKLIGTRPFFWCMHEQPVFKQMGLFKDEHYPVAEKLARNGFYLPSGLGLSEQQQMEVISYIKKMSNNVQQVF
ncbi:putative pyridoxal phosphate-dependent aminotransferase EpsN [compost metagenome]